MGLYNSLTTSLTCPRCGLAGEMDIDLYFGFVSAMDEYRIGDRYRWGFTEESDQQNRPLDGNADGEGYCVCPKCQKDFFVIVKIRDDRIAEVMLDESRWGYIP